jgi:hypothetical protein
MSDERPDPRVRRWFQFGLRSLMAVVLLAALGLGLVWLPYIEPYRREQQALRSFGYKLGDYDSEPRGPQWLRWLGTEKYLQRIVRLHLARIDDEEIKRLVTFSHLRELRIDQELLTGDGLKTLGRLSSLESLDIDCAGVSEAAVGGICGQDYLEKWRETGRCSNGGLRSLQPLIRLRHLRIVGQVADADMPLLEPLRRLESLECLPDQNPGRLKAARLLQDTTELDFRDLPLRDVLDYLDERHGSPLKLRAELPQAIQDRPVTARSSGITLYEGLESLLPPLGLDWRIDDRGLYIDEKPAIDATRPGLLKLRQALPGLKRVVVAW